ncbi:MAG: ParB family transcriptional regulator, chromosome partitioning protein, partial [Pseudonocardiales bacterium]|nr:ParB family transcriptional regulator, chromosome partitioning protein [Pseudonocardiales bacterium]
MSDRSTARSAHKARRGGLGRGLGALIPTAPAPDQAARPGPADVHFGAASADTPDHEPERETAAPDPSDGPLPVPGATYAELPIASVHPNAKQPRQVFDEDALAELAHSVREFGVLQPVVVRADAAGGYELVMGERRL